MLGWNTCILLTHSLACLSAFSVCLSVLIVGAYFPIPLLKLASKYFSGRD